MDRADRFLRLFVAEASEHADALARLWPRLVGQRFDEEAIAELFRHAHSIKGMAATMGFEEIVELSRAAEQLLGELRDGRTHLPEGATLSLFRASDLLAEMIRRRGAEQVTGAERRLPLVVADLMRLIPDRDVRSSEVGATAVEDLEKALRERLRTVRVATDTLDGLLDASSDLLLGVARLRELGKKLGPSERSQLEEGVSRIHNGALELHGQVVKARLMPLSILTDRLPQHVRQLALSTGHQAELRVTGAELELDRSIVDGLADILLHLLRNCVDHGIEPARERLAGGKAEVGMVTVEASREQDQLRLEVTDDGRGFNLEALRLAAVKAGRADLRTALALPEAEVLMLACLPGITTAASVSDVSGRGVGLDVVKAAVEGLSGTFAIESQPGRGARFRIALPLSVALIKVLLVEVDREIVALPMGRVIAAVELAEGQRLKGIDHAQGFAPLHALSALLGWSERPPDHGLALIWQLQASGETVALQIDRLVGQHEAVVKPVGPPLDRMLGISAVTLLGNGQPAFILDVPRLLAA
jgi:two-component system, chemotaxis family, sensor kinase CheA